MPSPNTSVQLFSVFFLRITWTRTSPPFGATPLGWWLFRIHSWRGRCTSLGVSASLQSEQQLHNQAPLGNTLVLKLEEFHPRFGFLAALMPQCEELQSKGMQMAYIHSCLMAFYQGENEKLVSLTAKTHFVMHPLYNARWAHPSLVWCSKGEDMQRVAKLRKSCLDGCKQWQVAKRASWKERHLLAMRSKVGWKNGLVFFHDLLLASLCSTFAGAFFHITWDLIVAKSFFTFVCVLPDLFISDLFVIFPFAIWFPWPASLRFWRDVGVMLAQCWCNVGAVLEICKIY